MKFVKNDSNDSDKMVNSKLILLLNTFETSDWRSFSEFLNSPYFNKNKEAIHLFDYLRRQAPAFESKKLKKELVYKKVYPKKEFDNKLLEDLIYHLLKQAENFLKINRLERDERTGNLLLLEELMERKLDKNYRTYYKKASKLVDKPVENDGKAYLFQYQLSDIARRNFIVQNKRTYDPILERTLSDLDQFYFFAKLKSTCELLDWKNVVSVDVKVDFVEPIITHLLAQENSLHPIISIYLTVYHLLTKSNADDDFIQLRQLLKEHQSLLPDSEKSYLYLFGVNYCTLQMQKNNQVYYYVAQCLELYLEGVTQRFLYNNGHLTPWTFKNIVKLGFNLKKYEWTANFIQEYHTHLEENYQADAFHYNMADLNYRNKNHAQALTHLMQVQYSDIFYNLGAKTMLIKIYYETDEEEALLSMIASFTIYLKRNKKIAHNFRLTYLNFTNYLYKIIRTKPSKLPDILEEVKEVKLLANRRWLLSLKEHGGVKKSKV